MAIDPIESLFRPAAAVGAINNQQALTPAHSFKLVDLLIVSALILVAIMATAGYFLKIPMHYVLNGNIQKIVNAPDQPVGSGQSDRLAASTMMETEAQFFSSGNIAKFLKLHDRVVVLSNHSSASIAGEVMQKVPLGTFGDMSSDKGDGNMMITVKLTPSAEVRSVFVKEIAESSLVSLVVQGEDVSLIAMLSSGVRK